MARPMSKRHPNPRLVKSHRNYTVEEVARLFDMHRHTVRRWLQLGLPYLNDRKPYLILGADLVEFISVKRTKHKRKCEPGQIYCVRCRAPKAPVGAMADYLPTTDTLGSLCGICPDCDLMMYRRVSLAKLHAVRGDLDVTMTKASLHIGKSPEPFVNVDFPW